MAGGWLRHSDNSHVV